MSKSSAPTSNTREDVLSFLESLDTYSVSAPGNIKPTSTSGVAGSKSVVTDPKDAQYVLDFLDEISQRSNTSTPKKDLTKITSQSLDNIGSPAPTPVPPPEKTPVTTPENSPSQSEDVTLGPSWSWGGIWKTASAAVSTAQNVVDSQVKQHLGSTDPRKLIEERMRSVLSKEQLDRLGADLKKVSTAVLNAVAPPIAQHEIVQVWLSHDMVGYSGIEALVYRCFAKILEQIEGGDLIVQSGKEEKHKDLNNEIRNLNACEGFIQANKLAKANIEQQIKFHFTEKKKETMITETEKQNDEKEKTEKDTNEVKEEENKEKETEEKKTFDNQYTLPITTCNVFMSIQPCKSTIPGVTVTIDENVATESTHLFFILCLNDPGNMIEITLPTQPIPLPWLDIPFEDNEWVEDTMIDILKLGVTTLAMNYMWKRGRYLQTPSLNV